MRKGLTLQDMFYIAMIVWVGLSILALLYDLIVVGLNLLHGNYNVTIPLKVGLTIPLT